MKYARHAQIQSILCMDALLRARYSTTFMQESTRYKPIGSRDKILAIADLCPNILNAEYAVRGEISIAAERLSKQLSLHPHKYPFDRIIQCNIGNPQLLGQRPLTYVRQVLSLLETIHIWNDDGYSLKKDHSSSFPNVYTSDVIKRAIQISKDVGRIGAYSHSKGSLNVRKHIAEFIEKRDGFPSDPENIFLCTGASGAIMTILRLIIQDQNTGILIPCPQYPLYSAAITLLGGHPIFYNLNESQGWDLSITDIENQIHTAREKGIRIRAICIIQPGNPTGNLFRKETLQDLITLCHRERLVLLADEVYQENVYEPDSKPFVSAKKILGEMGKTYDGFELFSFHSASKGMFGECGRRAGYVECTGISEEILSQIYKLCSINLCSNVAGQAVLDLMVRPPNVEDASYAMYQAEKKEIYQSLKRRAAMLTATLNECQGVYCRPPDGALYVFPRYEFPPKFLEEAQQSDKEPDTLYALMLLNATGICTVNGSGFGQVPGTHHIRFTFLWPEADFSRFCDALKRFHSSFMKRYGS